MKVESECRARRWIKSKNDRFEFGVTEEIPESKLQQADKAGWFFDIYIQGSKYNF